ncbi:MAG: hypothetical protein ABEK12_00360, partial [Candidatus Nanohaloarchaea archaeon]
MIPGTEEYGVDVTIDPAVKEKAKRKAKMQGRGVSVSRICEHALREWISSNGREVRHRSCPDCGSRIAEQVFQNESLRANLDGECPTCGTPITQFTREVPGD